MQIKDITNKKDRSKELDWIKKVYQLYPHVFNGNHLMIWGESEDQDFVMFKLSPSGLKNNAVEIDWFQAYPLRHGIGTRGMTELQRLAREDNISLTLYPWDKGKVTQSKLIKFYKSLGFNLITNSGKSMIWNP